MSASITTPSTAKAGRWPVPAVCVGLAAITFAVFGQTWHYEFITFDDGDYVYANPMVARGLTLKGIVWAFSFHAHNWHPLAWLSHMLDCQIYGLQPGGPHLTNVLLHTATVIVLFLVLREMTGAFWRSAFVAAVFAIHPLRVESVAWVAERKDVLSGLFFMLTIGAYVRYARRLWSWGRYGLVLFLFTLGLMSKPMLVTLPLVLLLLDYWPLQRAESAGKLVMEKLPLLALSAAGCVATFFAQTGAIQTTEAYSVPMRLGNALITCMVYLKQMVYPAGLALFYPYPRDFLSLGVVALAGVLLAGFSAVVVWQRRKQPWILFGWLWYLVTLLPVVGIIQVGTQSHADRYTYLPQIGIYVAVTWLVAGWVGKRLAAGLMTGIIAVLMFCAGKQAAYWQNSETLWARSLACTTHNATACYGLGNALYQKGSTDAAIAQYQEALRIKPDYKEAENNLGMAFLKKGRVDDAIAHYQLALQIDVNYALARFNLATALFQKGEIDEAIVHFQKALQLETGSAEVYNNFGTALLQKGAVDEAIVQFQKALQIKSAYATAHYNLGNAFFQKGRTAEAIRQYQQALQLTPADPDVQNNLAWLLAAGAEPSLRNGSQAVELARKANEISGGKNPFILHTLAAALAEAGRFSDATSTAQKAIELARAAGQQDLAEQLNGELQRYKAGLPLHDAKQ